MKTTINRIIVLVLVGIITLSLNLLKVFSYLVHADEGSVNESVVFKEAPTVTIPEVTQLDFFFEIPPGGLVEGTTSEMQKFELKPVEVDASTLKVISLMEAESLKEDEKMSEDALLMLEMYGKFVENKEMTNLIDSQQLENILMKFENIGKVKPNDMSVMNIFDVWFENSNKLRHNTNPEVFVTISLELGNVPNDIFALVQYDGEVWSVIDSSSITKTNEGIYNVSLMKMAPIAILGVSLERYEEINNPYFGETLPALTGSFGGIIAAEVGAISVITIVSKKKIKKVFAGLPLFGIEIAWSTIIVLIAEILVSTILAIILVNILLDYLNNKKNNENSEEKSD